MDVKETADYLSVSSSLVYKLAQRGELPCVKVGQCVRFSPYVVENYVNRKNISQQSVMHRMDANFYSGI